MTKAIAFRQIGMFSLFIVDLGWEEEDEAAEKNGSNKKLQFASH